MKNLKKGSAILLSLIMLWTLCANVFAVTYNYNSDLLTGVTADDESTLPTLTAELVKSDGAGGVLWTGETDAAGSKIPTPLTRNELVTAAATEPTTFLVALRAKNYTHFKWNSDGLFIWQAGLAYDPTYIDFEPTTDTRKISSVAKTRLKDNIMPEDINHWDFENETYRIAKYASKTSEDNVGVASNCTSTIAVEIDYNSTDTQYIYTLPDDEYIFFIELQLKSVPPDGTTVLSLSKSDTDLALQFSDDSSKSITYNGSTQLETILKLDEQELNITPAKIAVTYDANSGNSAFSTAKFVDSVVTGTDNLEKVEDGSAPTGKNENGTEISSLLEAPDGYVFEGWYLDSECTTKFTIADATDTSHVTNNAMTVYANYIQGHKATFHLNGSGAQFADSSTDDKTFQAATGDSLFDSTDDYTTTLGGDPTREGYTFKGWYTKNASTGAFETNIPAAVLTGADTTTLPGWNYTTDSLDLYAQWMLTSPGTYTLNFDKNTTDNSVTEPNPTSITYNANDSLDSVIGGLPVEPTRTGYKFMGWYKSQNGDGEMLTSSTQLDTYMNDADTVYARWDYVDDPDATPTPVPNSDTITIRFQQDSGDTTYAGGTYTYGTVEDKYIKYGDTLEYVPVASEFTYTDTSKSFAGWYTQPQDSATESAVKIVPGTTVFNNTLDNNTSLADGGTVTLYPWYTEKVTVDYDLNGFGYPAAGTAPSSVTDFPGETFTVADALTASDYVFTEWNTKADGSGIAYKQGDTAAVIPDSNTTLYAIYQYNGTDKIAVVFHGNGTATNAAELTPHDNGATDTYTMYRAPGSTITAAQMPAATRNKYTFDHWAETAVDAVGSSTANITVALSSGQTQIDRYAIWKVTDPSDLHTVTFYPNKSDTTPSGNTAIQVADGDTINAAPTYTLTGWNLKGWSTNNSATEADYDLTTAIITSNVDLYGVWAQEVTVKYNLNGGTLTSGEGSADDVTLDYNGTLQGISKTTPTVEKTGYKFDGWKYKDSSNTVQTFTDTTNVTADITVYAAWSATVRVDYDDAASTESGYSEYTYDGTAKTPITTGNLTVTLLNPSDNTDESTFTGVTANDFNAGYQVNGTTPDNYTSTVPVNAGTYDIELAFNTNNTSSSAFDFEWTTYTIFTYQNMYYIKGVPVDYIISNNYRYESTFDTTSKIGIAVDGTAPTGLNIGIADILNGDTIGTAMGTTGRQADIDIKFTDKNDTSKVFTNTMPTDFGEYDVEITASNGSNYEIGSVKDSLASASPAGDANLHIIRTVRKITFDYADPVTSNVGYAASNGVSTNTTKADWTTVTIPTPSPVTDVSAAITAFASQTPSVSMPVEGTDYIPPTGKTLDKFVIATDNGGTTVYTTEFNSAAIKPGDDLTVYATYKDASWSITFEDTKSSDKEDTLKYTVTANKAINDTDGSTGDSVTKIENVTEGTEITSSVADKRALPVPEKAADNYMFYGWTTDQTLANTANLKTNDLTDVQKATIVTKDDYPTKTGTALENAGSDVTVYALYVLSDDATLSAAVFNENTSSGAVIPYKDNTYNTPSAPITFDPDDDTYYMVVANSVENVYAKVTPDQKGSTIKVTKNGGGVTVSTPTTDGSVEFTEAVAATTYDKTTDKNSVNVFIVTVTAPDGSSSTYTFNVLRYAKARVELNYGNSPYGMIMSMNWDDTTKATVKTNFNLNNKFTADNLPTNANTTINYTLQAWGGSTNPDENMDRNDTAIFIYQKTSFKDPGFTAYNSLGQEVDATDVTRTIDVLRMSGSNISEDLSSQPAETITVTGQPANYTFTELTPSNKGFVRPDVYDMTYTFKDIDGITDITGTRKVVVLFQRGDTNLDNSINGTDQTAIVSRVGGTPLYNPSIVPASAANLFVYRSVDTNMDGSINGTDQTTIVSRVGGTMIIPFYATLN